MGLNRNKDDGMVREPLLAEESPMRFGNVRDLPPKYPQYSYSKLTNQTDSPSRFEAHNSDAMSMQDKMLSNQDDQLQAIGNSVSNLKSVSKQIGIELDEQTVMLDDLNTELEITDSHLDSNLKKIAKTLSLQSDQRQWMVIMVLSGLLVVFIILFIII